VTDVTTKGPIMSGRMKRELAGCLILMAGLLTATGGARGSLAAEEARVLSPDGAVELKVFPHESRLHYTGTFKNRPVIESSPWVFSVDGVELTEDPEVGEVKPYQVKETYPWRGVHSQAVNRCNGATVHLRHAKNNTAYSLELRAYNDGVAFR